MKKTEQLNQKLEAAGLFRATDRVDALVEEIYGESLYDILDEHERREARPLARVAYEEKSSYCSAGSTIGGLCNSMLEIITTGRGGSNNSCIRVETDMTSKYTSG